VRLAKDGTVAGIPAPVARAVLRKVRGSETTREWVQELLAREGVADAEAAVVSLVDEGYLARLDGFGDEAWVKTTISGNAVAMASFGKPITRATADRLVAGLIERAQAYNADAGKPLLVARLRVFGSYLDPAVDRLGDVDIEYRLEQRPGYPEEAYLNYGRRSGRQFSTLVDELAWPQLEAVQILKARSAALNLTYEDVDRFTDRAEIIFEAG